MIDGSESRSPRGTDARAWEKTPAETVTPGVYQTPVKSCKGPCGSSFPGTPEYFQRCKKYKDGLDSWCKPCARARRRDRDRRSGIRVAHSPRFSIDAQGSYRCTRCQGRIYDSGLDDEWYCIACGAYVNPDPKPYRYRKQLETP